MPSPSSIGTETGTYRERRLKLPACVTWPAHFVFTGSSFDREFHQEQVAIENSMRDMNAALGQLNGILMSLAYVACAVVLCVVAVSPPPDSSTPSAKITNRIPNSLP